MISLSPAAEVHTSSHLTKKCRRKFIYFGERKEDLVRGSFQGDGGAAHGLQSPSQNVQVCRGFDSKKDRKGLR